MNTAGKIIKITHTNKLLWNGTQKLSGLPRIKSRFGTVVKLSDEQSSLNYVAEVTIYKRDIMIKLTSSFLLVSVSETAANKCPDLNKTSEEKEPEETIYSGTDGYIDYLATDTYRNGDAPLCQRHGDPDFVYYYNSATRSLTRFVEIVLMAEYLFVENSSP
jgi:hypothetical protein